MQNFCTRIAFGLLKKDGPFYGMIMVVEFQTVAGEIPKILSHPSYTNDVFMACKGY